MIIEIAKDAHHQVLVLGVPLTDISVLILFISLVLTIRAIRETARANILTSLPVLTLSYNYHEEQVSIKNIGKGAAVNIKLDKFVQWYADHNFNLYGKFPVHFDKVAILDAGQTQVMIDKTEISQKDPLSIGHFMMFSGSDKPLKFAIRFSDLSGKRFITKVRLYKGDVKIIKHPRTYGVGQRLAYVVSRSYELTYNLKNYLFVKYRKVRDPNTTKKKDRK